MDLYALKLKRFIGENKINCEQLIFAESCHTVYEAAKAAGANPEDCVKNICLIAKDGRLIVAIVIGDDKVSLKKLKDLLGIGLRIANPEEILEKTGYPCGGTPSFGYDAIFLVDTKVMEKESVLTGGGSQTSLVKISPKEILRANHGKVAEISK